jgi:branched-chain amino acid transport system ATP-binding protein
MVHQVTRDFGGLRALDKVDLEVTKGHIVGLIGPNGSGKTTLFNIVTGMLPPSGGRVFLDRRDITGLPMHTTSRLGIARTFQQVCLFNQMTAIENVIAGRIHARSSHSLDALRGSKMHWQHALTLLEFVGLTGKEGSLAGSLPYGDQRKLEVARALAPEPRLLLLDEPLAGMNPVEVDEFIDMLPSIRRAGVSILLIEHNVQAVMRCCEPIYVFDYGKKIAQGKPSELLSNDVVIKAYLGETASEITRLDLFKGREPEQAKENENVGGQ